MALKAELGTFTSFTQGHDPIDQFLQILRTKKCRGATSQVYFLDPGNSRKQVNVHAPFIEHRFYIRLFHRMIHGDPFVTGTKSTQAFTIGKVHVETDPLAVIGFFK
jgi:hypothetical protein